MISGQISPHECGLNVTDAHKIAKLYKFAYISVTHFVFKITIPFTFALSIIPFVYNATRIQLLLFSLPWSVLFTISVVLNLRIFVWKTIYLVIICYQLVIKLKNINQKLKKNFTQRKLNSKLYRLINSLNLIHTEIFTYNEHWSGFLLVSCVSLICTSAFLIHAVLLGGFRNQILRLALTFGLNVSICLFITVLHMPSLVALHTKNSYRLLNNILALTSKRQLSIMIKFKVINKTVLYITFIIIIILIVY